MTKIQKIWLWISIAMFTLPEILWSPILTCVLPFFMGSSYKFRNSLIFSGYVNPSIPSLILFIQCLGITLAAIILYKNRANIKYKYVVLSLFFLISLVSLLVLFLQLMLSGSDLLSL